MRYRLQRHDGTDCSATMVPITVLRMVPIQRYRHFHETFASNSVISIEWDGLAGVFHSAPTRCFLT